MIKKHAGKIQEKPWNMKVAAKALRDWINDEEPPTALLDVSYCALGRIAARDVQRIAPTADNAEAVSLEPEPGHVTIHEKRVPIIAGSASAAPKVSPAAKFVYKMARDLRANHGMEWGRAISMSEEVWKHSKATDIKAIHDAEKVDARGDKGDDTDNDFETLSTEIPR